MGGDSLEHAADAFLKELTDFFPNPRVRAGLKTIWQKSQALRGLLLDRIEADLEAVDVDSEAQEIDQLIWHTAGILGVDPGPFTLRELLVMAEGRSRAAWNHTGSMMALLANINRDPKRRSKPYRPRSSARTPFPGSSRCRSRTSI